MCTLIQRLYPVSACLYFNTNQRRKLLIIIAYNYDYGGTSLNSCPFTCLFRYNFGTRIIMEQIRKSAAGLGLGSKVTFARRTKFNFNKEQILK